VGAEKGFLQYSFAGGVDGAYPESDLIMDAAGNLYGTTNQGGAVGGGTVFELTRTHDGWKHQVLHSFADGTNDGGGPMAGLVLTVQGTSTGLPHSGWLQLVWERLWNGF
jgi:uncharacterized repeat protein (TIGR03803 family)